MKAKLIDVGRQKVNVVVEIDHVEDIIPVVKKYLMLDDIAVQFDTRDSTRNMMGGTIIVDGFRSVGKVEITR